MKSSKLAPFPFGKAFALTFIDDTDVATVENVRLVYDLLHELGMGATKTVWPLACPEGSADYFESETLEDVNYRKFVLHLQELGFEITWHSATMESSRRERVIAGLESFRATLGHYPRIHANHALNLENVYWGADRIDNALLRALFSRFGEIPASFGHAKGSEFWWGDLCEQHIEYARNLTFDGLDICRLNPSMPYRDHRRPLVRWWFSAADANDAQDFTHLLRSSEQERLERSGGFSIVATHFGKNFVVDGRVDPAVEQRLRELARRPGWFPTVGELLDWLRKNRGKGQSIPRGEWQRMQWHWAKDLLGQRWRKKRRKYLARAF